MVQGGELVKFWHFSSLNYNVLNYLFLAVTGISKEAEECNKKQGMKINLGNGKCEQEVAVKEDPEKMKESKRRGEYFGC